MLLITLMAMCLHHQQQNTDKISLLSFTCTHKLIISYNFWFVLLFFCRHTWSEHPVSPKMQFYITECRHVLKTLVRQTLIQLFKQLSASTVCMHGGILLMNVILEIVSNAVMTSVFLDPS